MWAKAAVVAALGGDGTRGMSRLSLVSALRLYRSVPQRVRVVLNRHPEPGSSAQALAAALGGLGVAGVVAALMSCGCMSRTSACYAPGRHSAW
jgi:hypothetical protein